MAKSNSKLSEVLEAEWVDAIVTAWNGLAIILVGALLLYFMKFRLPPPLQLAGRLICVFILLIGIFILILAMYRSNMARKLPTVPFRCPYCEATNLFLSKPTDDFECDSCHRTVHFAFGEPVPVRTVICRFCRTEHRVAMTVQRYVCDRCNRLLDVGADPTTKVSVVGTAAVDNTEAMLQNYDVVLVAIDRRRENELAFKLQNLLVLNLVEARKQMLSASGRSPLVVAHDVPHGKAEAVRRQLQELGATASLRAVSQEAKTPQRTAPR